MKKIFTLFAATMMAAGAMAQGVVLDANRIATFYKTFDGTSFEQLAGAYGYEAPNNLLKNFGAAKPDGVNANRAKFFPMNYDGGAPNNMNDITLTADYTDPETGFSIPAGHYTTLCNNDLKGSEKTLTFYVAGTNTHICNIKKMVVYLAGLPASNSTSGTLFADYGRINSTLIYTGSSAESAYKNPVSDGEATRNWLGRYIYSAFVSSSQENVPVYNPGDKSVASNTFTQDKLYRVVINFKDAHDPDNGTGMDGNNVVSLNNNDCNTERAIDESCYNKTTGKATCDERVYNVCHKFDDPDGDGSDGKGGVPGYYSYDWTWNKDMGFALQIKKSFNLFAVALVCGDDNAKTYISHVKDARKATWEEVGTTGINTVTAESTKVAPRKQLVNGQIVIGDYNIAGQRVK